MDFQIFHQWQWIIILLWFTTHTINWTKKKHTSFINLFLIGIIIFHRSKVTELFFRTMQLTSLQKIPQFHVISWCGNFVERHSFRIFPSKIICSLLWECEIIGATLLSIQLRYKTSWCQSSKNVVYLEHFINGTGEKNIVEKRWWFHPIKVWCKVCSNWS